MLTMSSNSARLQGADLRKALSSRYLRDDIAITEPKTLNLGFDPLPFTPHTFEKKRVIVLKMHAHFLVVQQPSISCFCTHDGML
jgi:hypothetical protein